MNRSAIATRGLQINLIDHALAFTGLDLLQAAQVYVHQYTTCRAAEHFVAEYLEFGPRRPTADRFRLNRDTRQEFGTII